MRKHVRWFKAVDEAGNERTIHVYVIPVVGVGVMGNPTTELRTDGLPVKRLSKGQYLVETTGRTLTSADPNAP